MDYYTILGVERTATQDEIKRAYRRLAKAHHPDSGGDAEKFKQINEAYSTIGDEQKRREYDRGPRISANDFSFHTQDSQAFQDFFHNIFGASAGFHHSQYAPPRNKDLRATIEVDVESVISAQRRTLHLKTGRSERTVEVDIPAGVNDGATIRYRGFGQDILTQAPPGDLVVTIRVRDTERFRRIGADVHSRIAVDAIDAIVGTTVEFEGIDGSKLNVYVPAGAQHGQMLRLMHRGLPVYNSDQRGHLYLQVTIVIPRGLSDEQKNVLRQLRTG